MHEGKKICRPSVISPDWVEKGFHIHVGDIELVIRPGHKRGMVVPKVWFTRDRGKDVKSAVRSVVEQCLRDPAIREKWLATLDRAMAYCLKFEGQLKPLARGRLKELSLLRRKLRQYEAE